MQFIRRKKRRTLSILIFSLILMLAVTGCKGKVSDGHDNFEPGRTESKRADIIGKPYEFTIFRTTWTNIDEENDIVIQELNRRLNIKIRIMSSPYETWKEKYNLLMSSDNVPDISVTTGPGTLSFNEWARQGKYLDITDLYNEYCPNVRKNVSDELIDKVKLKGRLYGIPRPTVSDRALVIRADWLENLNLSMPGDVYELYAVLKAFTYNDPDRNGQQDTYGLLGEDTFTAFQDVFEAFGCPLTPDQGTHWYVDDNGNLSTILTHPNIKEAIKFLRKLYVEKLLDPEWMLTKSQAFLEKLRAGKAGCTSTSLTTALTMEIDMKKTDPNVRFEPARDIVGPNGEFQQAYQEGWYMMASISSNAEKPEKLLELLDYCMTEEGYRLLRYGIAGITYILEDGKIVINEEEAIKHGLINGHAFISMMSPARYIMPENERTMKYFDILKAKFDGPFKPNIPEEIPSLNEVTIKQGSDMIRDMVASIISGEGNVDEEWDKMVNLWMKTGGEQLLTEVNLIYENNK